MKNLFENLVPRIRRGNQSGSLSLPSRFRAAPPRGLSWRSDTTIAGSQSVAGTPLQTEEKGAAVATGARAAEWPCDAGEDAIRRAEACSDRL